MLAFAVTRKRVVLAGTAALALGALGACKSDKILNVSTPDVLPPAAFSTPAGADPLRFGVISDFVRAYDGNTDSYVVASGNLADELYATDTFDGRLTINSRKSIEVNPEMETEYRYIQQANVGASTAALFLATSVPTQKWQRGEMYLIRGYTEIFMAEAWCSGSAISTVAPDGTVSPGTPNTTAQLFTRAAADFDSALTLADTSQRVKYGSQIGKGRALLNLAKYTEAAAAVAGVPRTFQYLTFHSTASAREENGVWNAEANGSTRYSIISNEGTNGLPYLATTTDPRIRWKPSTRIGFNAISTNIPTELKFDRTASGVLADGTEGQLIALEARLQGNTQADRDAVFAGLNALRTSNTTSYGVGEQPSAIPAIAGTAPTTQAAAIDQLFQERAYWMWLTGHRLGDMRRLVRVYGRAGDSVFPIGNQPAPLNGTYGTGVTITIPKNEKNNTNFQGCLDDKA
jgi:hypothetical protein